MNELEKQKENSEGEGHETKWDGLKNEVPFQGGIEITQTDLEKVGSEWRMASEIMRREIKDSAEVREIMARQVAEPLGESSYARAVSEVGGVSERLARFGQSRFMSSLRDEVAVGQVTTGIGRELQEVPEDLRAKEWEDESYPMESYMKPLGQERYKMGRDVKMLGLMADLLNTPAEMVEQDGLFEGKTEHGAEMVADAEGVELLDPGKWESRKQVKDRVYEIVVDGKKYIQKERKSLWHKDLLGHSQGGFLTSREEFLLGRKLAEEGNVDKENFAVRFEKPLGAVTFPDGYSFAVFELDEAIAAGKNDSGVVEHKIISRIYRGEDAEYENLKEGLEVRDLLGERIKNPSDYERAQFFAYQKSEALMDAADAEKYRAEGALGVRNIDAGRNSMVVPSRDKNKLFDLVVFDYEFYGTLKGGPTKLRRKSYGFDEEENLRTQLLEKWGYEMDEER